MNSHIGNSSPVIMGGQKSRLVVMSMPVGGIPISGQALVNTVEVTFAKAAACSFSASNHNDGESLSFHGNSLNMGE